ncbi:MAG: ATP-grasp domain-containing protein [Reinekea sp.]
MATSKSGRGVGADISREYCLMHIVFIESNTTGTGYLLASQARKQGFEVLVLARDVTKYQFASDIAVESFDTNNLSLLWQRLTQLQDTSSSSMVSNSSVAAVMSTSEYFIETAATLAKKLNLPGVNPDAVKLCRDKYRMRQTLQDKVNFPVPCRLLTSDQDIPGAVAELNFPMVIKPRSGSGSCAVALCHSVEDIHRALADNREFLRKTGRELNEVGCLAEFFVTGQEYSVECFHGRAVSLTRKHLGAAPYFVEIGHDINFGISSVLKEHILAQVQEMLTAVGLTWGPAHVEIKVSESQLQLIEINPRLAGGMIPVLIEQTLGVNLLGAWLTAALGDEPDLTPWKKEQGAIRFLVPQHGQSIAKLLDDAVLKDCAQRAALPLKTITDIKLYKPVGFQSLTQGDFSDRIGHLIAVAPQLEFDQVDAFQSQVLNEVMCD